MKTVSLGNTVLLSCVRHNNPPTSNCTPREIVRIDSNNECAIRSIPTTSGVGVEDDANSGENSSPDIPTKGDGFTLVGNKVLLPQ